MENEKFHPLLTAPVGMDIVSSVVSQIFFHTHHLNHLSYIFHHLRSPIYLLLVPPFPSSHLLIPPPN